MKNAIFYIIFFIILFSNVNDTNQKKIYDIYHKVNIIFDFSNIHNRDQKNSLTLLFLESQKIISKLVLSNNKEKITVNDETMKKYKDKVVFKLQSNIDGDIIIFPILIKQKIDYKLKFVSSHKNNSPKIVLLYIKENINLFYNDENSKYELILLFLKMMTDSLGLNRGFLRKKHIIRNNYFATPDYLMGNFTKTIEKLYKLTGVKMPEKNISLKADFYISEWNKDSLLQDFRSEEINIKNDISETSMTMLKDMYFYDISKCEFEYIDNKKCYLVNQKCLSEKQLKSYYLRYGINQEKNNEIICYLSNKKNIKNNQCGKIYSNLLLEKLNYCPLITNKKTKKEEIRNYEVPEIQYYKNQTLNLLKPSPKCKSKSLRTIYFKPIKREENYSEQFDIETITLNKNKRKYFVTYLTRYESYYSVFLNILKNNGLIRSYYYNNNQNLFIKPFLENFLVKHNKKGDYFNKYQKIFHFIGNTLFYYKNELYRNYIYMKSHFNEDYNFMPVTYEYPKDAKEIQQIFSNYTLNINDLWLVKPKDLSCGSGIHILKSLDEEKDKKEYIITRYVSTPHLINEKKYDIRIYVLVTGFQPLRIYLYKEGLLRFAAEKYNLDLNSIENKFTHLTNTAINIDHKLYKKPDNVTDESSNEWYLNTYRNYLRRNNIDVDGIFDKMKDLIIKIMISGEQRTRNITKNSKINDMNMFNLFGFDIIIDDKYIPHLLEVNTKPAMDIYNKYDIIVKSNLFVDTLNIVGMVPFSHERNSTSYDKDIKYKNDIQNRVDDALCELTRPRGDYELIFPLKNNIEYYKKFFFKDNCKENVLFWKEIMKEKE